MPSQIASGTEARTRLYEGVRTLTKAVAVTYGPHGRLALLNRSAGLLSTKDGVSVAREVSLPDPVASIGCQTLKAAALTLNDEYGDGTSSVCIVTDALLEQCQQLINAGLHPGKITQGIEIGRQLAQQELLYLTAEVEEQGVLEYVALNSCNGDQEIATHLCQAAMVVGQDGVLLVEDGYSLGIELEIKEGLELSSGHENPTQIEVYLDGPLIAVLSKRLSTIDDVRSLMEEATAFLRPLLIVAPGFSSEVKATAALNREQQVLECWLLKTPGVHQWKREHALDLAALSNATFVDTSAGMDPRQFNPEWFGSLRTVTLQDRKSILIGYQDHDRVSTRIAQLLGEQERTESQYEKDKLQERISALSGGVGVLKVGGVTEAALKERRARLEDALGAVHAALQGGVVPGGGLAYLRCSQALDLTGDPAVDAGIMTLRKALERPLQVLCENAGHSAPSLVIETLKKEADWTGWDLHQSKMRDLGEEPMVLDPYLVVSKVIDVACSTASTLATAEVALTWKKTKR